MANWKLVKLEDIATFQEGYVNPPQTNNEYFDGDVKWLRAVDLNDSEVWDTSRKLTDVGFESAGKSALMFKPNTIAISKSGTIGRLGILKDYMCGNRAVINIEVDEEKADLMYVFYSLIMARREIIQYAVGSVQANLYPSVLGKLEIPLPPLPTQKKIASLISAIDNLKINNQDISSRNNEIIATLFRSWFIDFDPVKAKSEGKSPYGMNEETAALFPDSFEVSELGPIPTGWKWGQLGDCISVVGGGTPSTKNEVFWDGEYNWTSPKDLSNSNSIIMLDTEKTITKAGLAKVSSGLLPVDTVLMSSRAPIGYLALSKIPVAINQGYIAIPPKNSMSPNFMLSWIHFNMPLIEAYSSGSTFPEISKKEFRKLPILIPPAELIEKFNEKTTCLYDSMETSLKQMNSLMSTRDALLPRLMSGELSVS